VISSLRRARLPWTILHSFAEKRLPKKRRGRGPRKASLRMPLRLPTADDSYAPVTCLMGDRIRPQRDFKAPSMPKQVPRRTMKDHGTVSGGFCYPPRPSECNPRPARIHAYSSGIRGSSNPCGSRSGIQRPPRASCSAEPCLVERQSVQRSAAVLGPVHVSATRPLVIPASGMRRSNKPGTRPGPDCVQLRCAPCAAS
jgi:hypothetical protein